MVQQPVCPAQVLPLITWLSPCWCMKGRGEVGPVSSRPPPQHWLVTAQPNMDGMVNAFLYTNIVCSST